MGISVDNSLSHQTIGCDYVTMSQMMLYQTVATMTFGCQTTYVQVWVLFMMVRSLLVYVTLLQTQIGV
jgi:hypothetical protein